MEFLALMVCGFAVALIAFVGMAFGSTRNKGNGK